MSTAVQHIRASDTIGDLSIRDFLIPLFRRKRLLIVTFLAIFAVAALYVILEGPSYSARMAILVNRERQDPLVSTEATTQLITTNDPVTQEEINSEAELLVSRDVLEQVVTENGLEKPSRLDFVLDLLRPNQTHEDRVARAVKALAKDLKIANIKDSNLIEIVYKSPDPKLSYSVLKSLGDLYVAKHVAVHRPAGSYEFFAQETDKYHQELEAAEDKLRQFGTQNSVAAPDEVRTDLALQVAQSLGQQHATEQAIAADEDRIASDLRELKGTSPRSATIQAVSTNDALMSNLKAALLAAQIKRAQLAMKYDAHYPLVQEADEEIAQAKLAISQAEEKPDVSQTTDRDPAWELLREDIVKTRADVAAQRATLAATKQGIKSMQDEMVHLDQLYLTQQDLQREMKAAESNYLLYLGKREQERTSNALDITRISNVAIAVPPAIPALPVMAIPTLILIAFAAAAVLSLGTAYTVDYFDSSFHTPSQVIDTLGIPVVLTVSKKAA